jgi:hypothetical protein
MHKSRSLFIVSFVTLLFMVGCGEKSKKNTEPGEAQIKEVVKQQEKSETAELSDAEIENIVRRSYQYVAMYNVNNKFAASQGGWNTVKPDTELKDHTMREIARPNNDSLYIGCMLDLRKDPVILEIPAFDSKYVSLMITAYDHYVNVPMTTRSGDFRMPEKMMIYSARTEGYKGEAVEGVDRLFEASGDFVSAVFRVMPHGNEPERFKLILEQIKSVKAVTLSEYRGGEAKSIDDIEFPAFGKTDADVFENNLLEVMQFVFNHLTFDPDDEMDQAVLAAYEPLEIVPGQVYSLEKIATIDGKRFRKMAEKVGSDNLALLRDPTMFVNLGPRILRPKGQTDLDAIVAASVIGPIGLPMEEAMYPNVTTTDGMPMNAMNDYVVRMSKEELPPATAFWSLTLYDFANGFFVPNDHKKYSVGENAGMKLNTNGGIDIYVAAERPEGVPPENWLPTIRKDENLDIILRIYVPDLEKIKTWQPPKAEKIQEP